MRALAPAAVVLVALASNGAADEQPGVKGADLQLLDEVRQVADRVEKLCGTRFRTRPVAVRAPSDTLLLAARARAESVVSTARLRARGRAWEDLGLSEAAAPARLLDRLAADVAGIGLDPEGRRLLVAPDRLTDVEEKAADLLLAAGVWPDEPVVAHVLLHLLQREGGTESLRDTTDALLAASAWAEGLANLVALQYLFRSMGVGDDVLRLGVDPAAVLEGRLVAPARAGASSAEKALLEFVYSEGFAQAVSVYRSGGWESVQAASGARLTTRDVLHPDRAPLRPQEAFVPQPEAPAGLTLVDRDVLGEQGVIVLVSERTGKDDLALAAGDGWLSDALLRWEGPDGLDGVTQWETLWESPEHATEFEYAFGRAFEEDVALSGRTAEGHRVESGGRVYRIRREQARVAVHVMTLAVEERWFGAQKRRQDAPRSADSPTE